MRTLAKITATTLAAATLVGLTSMTGLASIAAADQSRTASQAGIADDILPVPAPEPTRDPSNAAGDPGDVSANAYHQGFTITNLSHYRLKLTQIQNAWSEDQLPPVGTIVEPGRAIGFQVTYRFGWIQRTSPDFQVLDANGNYIGMYQPTLEVGAFNTAHSYVYNSTGKIQHSENANQLTVMDLAGSVIDVPAGPGQAQVLNALCGNSSATCGFTPTKREKVDGPPHQVGKKVKNNSDLPQESVFIVRDLVGTSSSVEVTPSVGVTIAGIVESSLSATYGQTWIQEHEFTQEEHLMIPPREQGWIVATEPMIRNTGDFILTMGNTTWKLRGVSFDSPDKDGSGTFEKFTEKMTPQEQAAAPDGLTVPPVMATAFGVIQ